MYDSDNSSSEEGSTSSSNSGGQSEYSEEGDDMYGSNFAEDTLPAYSDMPINPYGSHDNLFLESDPDMFTPSKWRQVATRSLLQATKAVDALCHTVVATKTVFTSCPVAAEIRRLALTVAVFERSLFSYALRIKRERVLAENDVPEFQHPQQYPQQHQQQQYSQPHAELFGRQSNTSLHPSVPLTDNYYNYNSSSSSSSSSQKKREGELSGITPGSLPITAPPPASSFHHAQQQQQQLHSQFTRTSPPPPPPPAVFDPNHSNSFAEGSRTNSLKKPWTHAGGMVSLLQLLTRTLNSTNKVLFSLTNEISFFKYARHTKSWLLIPVVLVFRRKVAAFFAGGLAKLAHKLRLARLVLDFGHAHSTLIHYLSIPVMLYLLHRRAVHNRTRILKSLHSRLGVLLRLWHICVSVIDTEEQNETGQVAISQWMLELVPPSLDTSFWYQATWQLSLVKFGMDLGYAGVMRCYSLFGDRFGVGWPVLLLVFPWYFFRPSAAAALSSLVMDNPDLRFLSTAWRVFDSMLWPRWIWIFVGKIKPFFSLGPKLELFSWVTLSDELPATEAEMLHLSTEARRLTRRRRIQVLLMSCKPIDMPVNTKLQPIRPAVAPRPLQPAPFNVIIYLHGGGFVTDLRYSHLPWLKRWAVDSGAVVVYVDYSLAPANGYPTALDEAYDVFKWVSQGRLGHTPTSIVIAGDSSGGNLAVGVCLRSILHEDPRRPDGLVLAYPILDLQQVASPSRTLFMSDMILPMNLLTQCRSQYLPQQSDAASDPCLSPVVAKDSLLAKLPPTSIMVGGFDPFLDDSVDFAHRLHANAVPCRLRVYKRLPHNFLDFSPYLSDANRAVGLAARWLKSAFYTDEEQAHESVTTYL